MKKILFLSCLLITVPVFGQMIDLLSNMAIQGQMDAQSAKQLKTGFNALQQNELINKINLLIMDATSRSDKSNLQKSQFSYQLNPLEWNIQGIDSQRFSLTFQNVDQSLCFKLIHSLSYQSLWVNQQNNKECKERNSLKFIF